MIEYPDQHRLQIRAVPSNIRGRSVTICLFTQTSDVKIQLVPLTPGEESVEKVFIPQDFAQQLADDLYACGIRPSEAAGSAGAMAAVQEHLKDLRKMLFDNSRTRPTNQETEAK